MPSLHRIPWSLALVILVLVAVTACSSDEESVTIYSGRSSALVEPLLEQFADDTGVSVDVRYGESAELALLIDQEGDRTPADVYFSQSPGATDFLADSGRLATLPAETLDRVEDRFRDDEEFWVGVSGRQRVLVYNEDLVDPADLPASVFDVVEEPLAGQVAVAPSNGSFQDFITAMIASEGEETARGFLDALVDTGAPTYANNSAIVEAVGRGEVPMGLVNHYYNYRFLAEDADLPSRNHVFPGDDIGSLVIAATASVVDGTEQAENAQAVVDFLLSEEAQTYFAEETFEYPLTPDVDAAQQVPPLASLDVPSLDIDNLGDGLEQTLELIRESGLSG